MDLNGAKIYSEGVGIGRDCEEKIRQIVSAIKTLSPSSDISFRFLKSGRVYEGLLWGSANDIPIGVYRRGPSMTHVLDYLYSKVKKDCLKMSKARGRPLSRGSRFDGGHQTPLAMAG